MFIRAMHGKFIQIIKKNSYKICFNFSPEGRLFFTGETIMTHYL